MKHRIALFILIGLVLAVLTGCAVSGSKEEAPAASLHVVVAAPYVRDDVAESLSAELTAALPELTTETASLSVTALSTGDTETDPMSAMAGMGQISGMMAAGEVELLLCEPDNARRYADAGEAYIPLSELFTEAEIAELGIAPASVPIVDDMGNITDEMTAPCGADFTGSEAVSALLGRKDMGAYVLVGSQNVDNAKAVIRHLAGMK